MAPYKSPDHPRLANTMKSQGYSTLPQLCQLLPSFHIQTEITVLLTCFTCKGTPWHFSNECHSAFEALKKTFTTALVLTHWIPDTQITVKTDASDYALAAVLSITTPNGELHPIAFHSQPFLPWNSIMMSTTKSYLLFLKLSNNGDIILKVLDF